MARILDSSFRCAPFGISHEGSTLAAYNENVCWAETGDHKGRPYDGLVVVYFRSNDREGRPIIATIRISYPYQSPSG